ncbi:MAG: hypothetical protein Q9208_003801 [Pyrenodesmia sp. 3 TL-2023]
MATISSSRPTPVGPQPIPVATATQLYEYTCNSCQVAFRNSELQRIHMRGDWHQKHRLRVATLQHGDHSKDVETESLISSAISLGEPINSAPIEATDPEAEAEFSKVIDGIKDTKLDDEDVMSRRPSRPHHSAVEERTEHPLSEKATAESTPTASRPRSPFSAKAAVPLKQCLFCNYESPTFKLSVYHMTKFHGLFIPEQAYLIDLEGLVAYLYGKITELHECLYCHKTKGSKESIQTHMRDKGHCMIAYTSETEMIEVGHFYDFRSSYSDPESEIGEDDEDENKDIKDVEGGGKLRNKKCLKTVISDANGDQVMEGDADENTEGWETDSAVSSIASEDLTSIPIDDRTEAFKRLPLNRHHSLTDPRHHHQVDGYHSHAHAHHAVFRDEYELHLPSGRTAGHRSLKRYYRQNLHNYPTAAERFERDQRLIENARSADYEEMDEDEDEDDDNDNAENVRGREIATRANGNLSMAGVTDAKKRELRTVEKRDRKIGQRAQKQFEWGVNKRANNQKHFRDPLLQ